MMTDRFCSVPEAVEELNQSRIVVLIDDPGRQNKADLVMLAEHTTPSVRR